LEVGSVARRLRDGVNLLADWCERGLKIFVITQQIELNGPVGRLIAAVMLWQKLNLSIAWISVGAGFELGDI
jgi:hypothetical protein